MSPSIPVANAWHIHPPPVDLDAHGETCEAPVTTTGHRGRNPIPKEPCMVAEKPGASRHCKEEREPAPNMANAIQKGSATESKR